MKITLEFPENPKPGQWFTFRPLPGLLFFFGPDGLWRYLMVKT